MLCSKSVNSMCWSPFEFLISVHKRRRKRVNPRLCLIGKLPKKKSPQQKRWQKGRQGAAHCSAQAAEDHPPIRTASAKDQSVPARARRRPCDGAWRHMPAVSRRAALFGIFPQILLAQSRRRCPIFLRQSELALLLRRENLQGIVYVWAL